MRWTSRGRSANLEDRRGQRGPSRRGVGLGTLLLLVLLSVIFRQDFVSLLGPGLSTESVAPGGGGDLVSSPEEEALVDFVSFVLDDLQATWHRVLPGTIGTRAWCCSVTRSAPHAEWPGARPARSTVRATGRSIST